MNRDTPQNPQDSAAIQFMVLDILGDLLKFSENPGRMGGYLARQMRELVGARTVLLLQYGNSPTETPRIVAMEPEHPRGSGRLPPLEELVDLVRPLRHSALWDRAEAPEDVRALLDRMGCRAITVSPLLVGTELVGGLFAIDLLEMHRGQDVVQLLELMGPVVALVLRNSQFYESLEARIQERTRELARSEQHFRSLTEVLPVGIFRVGPEDDILFANARMWEILGQDLPLSKRWELREWIHPEDREKAAEGWRLASQERRTARVEFRMIRPSGEVIHLIGEAVAECGDKGEDRGQAPTILATLSDITDLKLAEQERHRLEEQLQQAQKMESMGRLAGGVAHDINNMLGAIMAHLELMDIKLPPADPLRQHTDQMGKAALRSRDIVRQLLAFSRKQVIAPENLEVNQRIEETRRTLAPLLGEDLELVFHPGTGICPIRFDPAQFDQILMNLAVNARDAMPQGGRLLIETTDCLLEACHCRSHPECKPGRYLRLSVSDQGMGMDPETLSHIFEPFYTTKASGHGTGLGLATVFGIVQQNRGFLEVTSQPGSGSRFCVYLPASTQAPEQIQEACGAPAPAGSGRVLVVEDDEALRLVIPSMLQRLGYQVCLADHPGHALELCTRGDSSFEIMLTDIVMPGMSGKELWDRVHPLRPDMRVLFMSGYTADMLAQRGVPGDGVHFIQKPFNLADLGRKIAEALN